MNAKPEAQEYVKTFAADYERVSADPVYMDVPAKACEWPCELSETEKYKAFGLSMAVPEEMEKARKQMRKMFRESGMDPDSIALMKYENIRIIPITAQAKDGKLEGEADVQPLHHPGDHRPGADISGEAMGFSRRE